MLTPCHFRITISLKSDTTSPIKGADILPSNTFLKLNPDKKKRVEAALLKEFSQYPLNQAQVARIIKEASIARGAFYKYFDDLVDAYQYLLHQELAEVHVNLKNQNYDDPQFIIQQMKKFIDEAHSLPSYGLFQMHFKYNENLLRPFVPTKEMSSTTWMYFVLSHETLRALFLDPDNQDFYFERFKTSISKIRKE